MAGTQDIEVLLVDDHEHMRVILAALLRAFGFLRIREARDGEQALRALAEAPADIVISDLKMPELNGVDFARRLRTVGPKLERTPVVMVTGHANLQRVAAARDAGVNEFIVKPVTGRLLADRLRRIIEDERPFLRTSSYVGPCRRRRDLPNYNGPFRRLSDGDDSLIATPKPR